MGLFRNRQEDIENPDLRASRYFLYKNRQSDENKLKNAERKYGYTLSELHAYKLIMTPPETPQALLNQNFELKKTYNEISTLLEAPESVNDTECIKCYDFYQSIDRCVSQVEKEDQKNRIYKHTRLHACKPHWVWLNRCVSYRDKQLLKTISKWEVQHLKGLPSKEQTEYKNQILGELRYNEYMALRNGESVEGVRYKKNVEHMKERVEKLIESGLLKRQEVQ